MSGCVNCVWDQFREDMEEFMAASAEADRRLALVEEERRKPAVDLSVDEDGGGSEANWTVVEPTKLAKDLWDEDIYRNVPVGIREFMKVEKRLKEQHEREGTTGS